MNRTNIILTTIIIALASTLSACNQTPEYHKPDADVPANFKIVGLKWNVVNPNDDFDRGQWWKIYKDPQLSRLEEKLNKDNFNVIAAAAQYRESLALVEEARASFFPTLNATLTRSKQRTSANSDVTSTKTLSLNASWEPDLWGAVASNVDSSSAAAQAAGAALESARLSAQASLAQYYFEFCTVNNNDRILRRIVNAYNENLDYITNRYQNGIANQADVLQADILLKTGQADAISNSTNQDLYKHAIAVLVGEHPSTFKLSTCSYSSRANNIPLGLPSTLLERRPDIAQAERLLAQSNADIGVAKAAYFPSLTLSGAGVVNLLNLPVSAWSLGSALTQSVFDGGARDAATSAATEKYNASVATYRQTVLAAFQDVEDNISTLNNLRRQEKIQRESAQNADLALELTKNQYHAGTVDYASVLDSKIIYYTSSQTSANLEGLRISTEIALIKALGGMWSAHN